MLYHWVFVKSFPITWSVPITGSLVPKLSFSNMLMDVLSRIVRSMTDMVYREDTQSSEQSQSDSISPSSILSMICLKQTFPRTKQVWDWSREGTCQGLQPQVSSALAQ